MNPKGNKMKRETVEEFLKRGGKVKKLKESGRTSFGGIHTTYTAQHKESTKGLGRLLETVY